MGYESCRDSKWEKNVIIRLNNEERITITFDEDEDVIIYTSSSGIGEVEEVTPAEAAITLLETITMVKRGTRSNDDAQETYPLTWKWVYFTGA